MKSPLRETKRKQYPLTGMFVAFVSICAFLAMLVALTAIVHLIVM